MSQRSRQVAEEVKKIVSQILIEDLIDTRMGFVTITHVDLTDDLRFARVYYSVLGTDLQQRLTDEAFEDNKAFIRRLTVQRINMKFAMDMKFERDKSIEQGFKIDDILKKIKEEPPKPEDAA